LQTGEKVRVLSDGVEEQESGNDPGYIRLGMHRLDDLEINPGIKGYKVKGIALTDKIVSNIRKNAACYLVKPGENGPRRVHQYDDIRAGGVSRTEAADKG
jgi:hypothetical protein